VADPALAPKAGPYIYAHPDENAENGLTWRQTLLRYNESGENPLKLARAFELYENTAYRILVATFGIEKVFILSAGWGLINAAFLTPYYDITFSHSVKRKAEPYKFRKKEGLWNDLCQFPIESEEDTIFFGGKDYVLMFCALTRSYRGRRLLFYNAEIPPLANGCLLCRYQTTTKTNWHYECVGAFLANKLRDVESIFAGSGTSGSDAVRKPLLPMRNKPSANSVAGSAHGRPTQAPPKAEDFRRALWRLFQQAESLGLSHTDVVAGELHREVGGYPGANHRMPVCCDVMRSMMKAGDMILAMPSSGRGASLVIRYALAREK
jgi:hypothetical protein